MPNFICKMLLRVNYFAADKDIRLICSVLTKAGMILLIFMRVSGIPHNLF